jgi:hypothetical protein
MVAHGRRARQQCGRGVERACGKSAGLRWMQDGTGGAAWRVQTTQREQGRGGAAVVTW